VLKNAEMSKKLGYPLSGKDSKMVDEAKGFVYYTIGKFGN